MLSNGQVSGHTLVYYYVFMHVSKLQGYLILINEGNCY